MEWSEKELGGAEWNEVEMMGPSGVELSGVEWSGGGAERNGM